MPFLTILTESNFLEFYDSLDLIQIFGIPKGHHLFIDFIRAQFESSSDDSELWIEIDQLDINAVEEVPGKMGYNTFELLPYREEVNDDANRFTHEFRIEEHVYNTLTLSAYIKGYITFKYHFEKGNMLTNDDMKINYADIKNVGKMTFVGQMFHQVGNKKKV